MNTLKNLFFGRTGSSLPCKGLPQFRALSSLQQGGGQSSLQWRLLLQSSGSRAHSLRSCGVGAQLPHSMWNLPRPGIEPVSPALAASQVRSGRDSTRKHRNCRFHPWVRKIPWRRKYWQLAPYFCLENSVDIGAWRTTVHGVAQSQTRLSMRVSPLHWQMDSYPLCHQGSPWIMNTLLIALVSVKMLWVASKENSLRARLNNKEMHWLI